MQWFLTFIGSRAIIPSNWGLHLFFFHEILLIRNDVMLTFIRSIVQLFQLLLTVSCRLLLCLGFIFFSGFFSQSVNKISSSLIDIVFHLLCYYLFVSEHTKNIKFWKKKSLQQESCTFLILKSWERVLCDSMCRQ